MKIPLGGGAYLEPDEGPRDTRFHRRIVSTEPLPNTKTGNKVVLDCGHQVHTYGRLELTGGVALCTQCRDEAEAVK